MKRWIFRSLHAMCLAVLLGSHPAVMTSAHAAEPDCTGLSRITETFSSGAQWDFCWESTVRESLVLHDVFYTPADGSATRVLSSARLGQLHVAYDDSDVTYNDITQYGLGGSFMVPLEANDCPGGELLDVRTQPGVCKARSEGPDAYRTATRNAQAESLKVFSVSQVGAYTYILHWTFFADGAFEPAVGATGALQRSTEQTELPFGRLLSGDNDNLWLSHTHNYYWRLDFDLGLSADDDVIVEARHRLNASGQRVRNFQRFDTEVARRIDPDVLQAWYVLDDFAGQDHNQPGGAKGYLIEPLRHGHRLVRPDIEPYTDFDFFVTVANDCERFASQNARFNPDCDNHVLQFADGQPLAGEDVVVWYRVSFHHVPRNEDQGNMHSHWDGFVIEPVNRSASTPGLSLANNSAPVLQPIADQSNNVGDSVHVHLYATDANSDRLTYSASGLPPGVEVLPSGAIEGSVTTAGNYTVVAEVNDELSTGDASFSWTVAGTSTASSSRGGGSLGLVGLAVLSLGSAMTFRRRQRRDTLWP